MSDQDMFSDSNQETKQETSTQEEPKQQETPAPSSDPFEDKLREIKNEEGKPKYKDVNTALEALSASQQFIEQLKREKREVEEALKEREEKLQKMGNIEDFVNRLKPESAKPQEETKTKEDSKGVSEEQLRQLLEQQLNEREGKAKQKANLDRVVQSLSQKFGDQAAAAIRDKAKELETTPAELKEMAMRNPNLVLGLFQGGSKVSSAPSQSSSFSNVQQKQLEKPSIEKGRGIARGGYSDKEMAELFRKSKEYTNKRLGIE